MGPALIGLVIFYSGLIPISLNITLEMVQLFQAFFIKEVNIFCRFKIFLVPYFAASKLCGGWNGCGAVMCGRVSILGASNRHGGCLYNFSLESKPKSGRRMSLKA